MTSSEMSRQAVPRFSERFCKLLQNVERLLVLDERLNVVELGLSSKVSDITKVEVPDLE